jgi:predicted O-methyltransferase YrrM
MSSPSGEPLRPHAVAEAAAHELAPFRRRVAGMPYERKGILYSEMLFFCVCVRGMRPRRILESGRARGQSTLLLALCFPDIPIISFEYDADSPDVPVAAARLKPFANVELRFGDATRLLPQLAVEGDVVLIDGPKGFRSIRLALSLLAQGRVSMVFLHDMTRGTLERRFLEAHVPGTLYSDEPQFAAVARHLDAAASDIPDALAWKSPGDGHGYGLACLQRQELNYRLVGVRAVLDGLAARIGK